MLENRKIKVDHDAFADFVSEMYYDGYNKIKESKSGYTSVSLNLFCNWVVYRYKIIENAKDIIRNWKPKKLKENYVEISDETLYRMAGDLRWNSIMLGLNQIFFTRYPVNTVYAFTKIIWKTTRKGKPYFIKKRYALKQVYENWVEYNNDTENSKTHRVYERKE